MNRSHSLTRAEVESCIKNGGIFHTPLFSVRKLDDINIKTTKTAFVASKKIFPTAVLRNKAKRRSKEAFRHNLTSTKKSHLVFFLKKDITTRDFKDLKSIFSKV